ncbi:MAG TPA: guanylate kinase [Steroidobacteraceae bacterium]|nr:guanylate kinase [Steroidobacteraceae bacterium]
MTPPAGQSGSASRGRLFVIAAPSGTGKTSLVKALMAAIPTLAVSTSFTTRSRRPTEHDGRDYHFVSREAFEQMVRRGAFLEHATVFDNRYGTGREQVEAALGRGQDLLLEIDWQGAAQIRKALPEAITTFILPPSRSALEQRLRARGTDTEEVIARRLKDSVTELSHWQDFEYLVVNDDFERALGDLKSIVEGRGAGSKSGQPALIRHARKLLD